MKIGNSTIQFNVTANNNIVQYDYCINKYVLQTDGECFDNRRDAIKEVPYWALYARKGDCISPNWKSTRVLTYNQIVEYLTKYIGHRVLEAYPRISNKRRNTYAACRNDKDNNIVHIVLRDSNYIVCTYDTNTKSILYISPNYKDKKQYFIKQYFEYPDWIHDKLSKLLNAIK